MKLNTTIITKKLGIILPILLLLVAAYVRLWRIDELTEFLGDQGRTGMVILDAWRRGSIPLAGPTVLTGQHLGPFFYYLIGPAFIIGRFNPIVPSIFMAMLGVASVGILFVLAKKLFGLWIGLAVATLYAISAYLIRADRTIWEPTVIPFFVLLYGLCVYELIRHRNYPLLILTGALVGILVQLHYPMIFFVGVSAFLFGILLLGNSVHKKSIIVWTLGGIGGFFFVLLPFLWYEMQHGWVDIREIAIIMVAGGGGQASLRYPERLLDASFKLFGYLAPQAARWFLIFLQGFVFVAALWKRTLWSGLLISVYILGIAMIGLYKGVVFDHYLFFLLPLPYLLLGHALWAVKKNVPAIILFGFVGLLAIINVGKIDVFLPGMHDTLRVRGIADEVLRSAKNQPFSFTLITSRSFSDLHYRYFFKLAGVEPMQITDATYTTLFLVCDQLPCPTGKQVQQKVRIQALCFESHCKGSYPTVDLANWNLKATLYAPRGRIYMFKRSGGYRQVFVQ